MPRTTDPICGHLRNIVAGTHASLLYPSLTWDSHEDLPKVGAELIKSSFIVSGDKWGFGIRSIANRAMKIGGDGAIAQLPSCM